MSRPTRVAQHEALWAFTQGSAGWIERAACRGVHPALFFPIRGEGCEEAKAVCEGCEVRAECLDFAVLNRELFGIWGGTSENERRRIRADRNKETRAA